MVAFHLAAVLIGGHRRRPNLPLVQRLRPEQPDLSGLQGRAAAEQKFAGHAKDLLHQRVLQQQQQQRRQVAE